MYSMDDLLHVVYSDGADELKLRVGHPPVLILDGEQQAIEGSAITTEIAEQLLRSITSTRQRRALRENGAVQFIYRFRGRADFVIRARLVDEDVEIDIH
jgi:Tfp pilus assembly pilus retraction ATPase PilT